MKQETMLVNKYPDVFHFKITLSYNLKENQHIKLMFLLSVTLPNKLIYLLIIYYIYIQKNKIL